MNAAHPGIEMANRVKASLAKCGITPPATQDEAPKVMICMRQDAYEVFVLSVMSEADGTPWDGRTVNRMFGHPITVERGLIGHYILRRGPQ